MEGTTGLNAGLNGTSSSDIEEAPNTSAVLGAGVFVYSKKTEQGLQVAFEILGDLDPLAVPSLLEVAQKVARQHVGLSP